MITDRSKRWRDRQQSFVPAKGCINPSEFGVEVIDCMKIAKPFVLRHHYSASFPVSRASIGLFRKKGLDRSELVGVATFSQPMNNAAIAKHTGLTNHQFGVELGRFILHDSVLGNGETFFLSRAFRALRQVKPGIEAVISYADPMIRTDIEGNVTKPCHIGAVYAVMGAAHRGRGTSRLETLTPDGQVYSDRDISKIRNEETGRRYAIAELIARGATPPRLGEDPRAWIKSLYEIGFLTKRRNPGNHVYSFELTSKAKLAGRGLPRLEYPRLDRSITHGDGTALPLLSRSAT